MSRIGVPSKWDGVARHGIPRRRWRGELDVFLENLIEVAQNRNLLEEMKDGSSGTSTTKIKNERKQINDTIIMVMSELLFHLTFFPHISKTTNTTQSSKLNKNNLKANIVCHSATQRRSQSRSNQSNTQNRALPHRPCVHSFKTSSIQRQKVVCPY